MSKTIPLSLLSDFCHSPAMSLSSCLSETWQNMSVRRGRRLAWAETGMPPWHVCLVQAILQKKPLNNILEDLCYPFGGWVLNRQRMR